MAETEQTLDEKISAALACIQFDIDQIYERGIDGATFDKFIKKHLSEYNLIITPGFEPVGDKHKDGRKYLIRVNYDIETVVEKAEWAEEWDPYGWRFGGSGVHEDVVSHAMPIPQMEGE